MKCDKLIRKFESAIERRVIQSNNIKSFYNFVGNKLNSRHNIAPLRNNDGSLLTADVDKAAALNQYFASVFTPVTDDGSSNPLVTNTVPVSPDVDFSLDIVVAAVVAYGLIKESVFVV